MYLCQTAVAAALAFALVAGAVPAASEGAGTLVVSPAGPMETVFDWKRDACAKTNVPDASARAIRAGGEVRLIISHNDNRALVGPDLDHLRSSCPVIYEGRRSAKLSDFDDLSWIAGLYTKDGRTVYALAHTELRGERMPGQCPAGKYSACLLNTVTALVSDDGGRSFHPPAGTRPPVVATLPYPFPTDRDARVGYANPSNIISRDGWYYTFIFADGYRDQKRGVCLIRTRDLADPASWRAYDGSGFSARFADPFRERVGDPQAHVCEPIAPKVFGRMVGGLVVHRGTGEVIAVFGDRRRGPDGTVVEGIFTATSRDLVNWSEPSLVAPIELLWDKSCEKQAAYFYPSLIDPAAETLSFEDFGDRGYLYLARYNLSQCKVTWDRDLVRIPVTVRARD